MVKKIARYILNKRVLTTLTSRGYKLICKICGKKFVEGDCIESKPSKYRNRKFYHCDCYDDSFIDTGDDENDEESK